MRDDRARLLDIARAIESIQNETQSGRSVFMSDPKMQVWVLYHLQTIGEAARSLTAQFRASNADPMWAKAIGLRNVLVH